MATTEERKKSGYAIRLWVRRALVAKWTAVTSELGADNDDPDDSGVEDPWPKAELQSSLTAADVRDSLRPDWTGRLAIAVERSVSEPEPAYTPGGGIFHWIVDITILFAVAESSDKTTRMAEHYLRVAELCLVDYVRATRGAVEDSRVVASYPYPQSRDIPAGAQGCTLTVRLQADHRI